MCEALYEIPNPALRGDSYRFKFNSSNEGRQMQIQKIIYWILKWILKMMLFLVLLAGTIASAVFAVITVIPDPFASKACRLGYKAHCAFTPISTIILVIVALILGFIFMRIYGKKILQIVSTMRRRFI